MSFAERICTTIVAHSAQQATISNLTERSSQLRDEVEYLRSENAKLNTSIGETNTLADAYAKERDAAHAELLNAKAGLDHLKEMLIQGDSRVSNLSTENDNLKHELEKAHADLSRSEYENANLRRMLTETSTQRDKFAIEAEEHQNNHRKAQSDLDALRETFAKVFGQVNITHTPDPKPLEAPAMSSIEATELAKSEPVKVNWPSTKENNNSEDWRYDDIIR